LENTMHVQSPDRTLTELDHVRLQNVLHRDGHTAAASARIEPSVQAVAEILDNAYLVSPRQVDADVVTMHSQVLIAHLPERQQRTVTVCYPKDARPADGHVSVLSPLGGALLGLRTGDVARWSTPGGADESAEVLEVIFQPEAHGDWSS
jgi:regulator of nucleoside diphosphate kinase